MFDWLMGRLGLRRYATQADMIQYQIYAKSNHFQRLDRSYRKELQLDVAKKWPNRGMEIELWTKDPEAKRIAQCMTQS